jgi:carboxypeptidase Q
MLGIGGSASTGKDGITAPIMLVKSYEELKNRTAEAKGKIVLYNAPYKNYGFNVQFRWSGALRASEAGAVGSLIRSVTPHVDNDPHTGSMAAYPDSIAKTPHAAISPEWADILERMVIRTKLRLNIYGI